MIQQNLLDWGRSFTRYMIHRSILPLFCLAAPLLAQEEWVEMEDVEATAVADISEQSRTAAEAGDAAALFSYCG